MFRNSLGLRIFFGTLIVIVLPLIVYLAFVFRHYYHAQLIDGAYHLQTTASSRAFLITESTHCQDHLLETLDALTGFFEELPTTPSLSWTPRFQQECNQLGYSTIDYFAYDGNQFTCTASSNIHKLGISGAPLSFLQSALKTNGQVQYTYSSLPELAKNFIIYKLLKDDKTLEPKGVLVMELAVVDLLNLLKASETSYLEFSFSLIDPDQVIFTSTDTKILNRKAVLKNKLENSEDPDFLMVTPFEKEKNVLHWKINDKEYIGTIIQPQNTQLTLLISTAKQTLVGVPIKIIHHFIIISIALVFIAFILCLWLIQRISRPMQKLINVMEQIAAGDYSAQFKADPWGFEVNDIGSGLNRMLDTLMVQMESTKNERVKTETLANELNIGRAIQLSILPQEMPKAPDFEIAARALPAKDVGGDFYDVFITQKENLSKQLVLSIADAAGKGISACLYSLCLRSMLRSFSTVSEDVGLIMQRANNLFLEDTQQTAMFVTNFTAIYEPTTRLLRYYSCGHPPALLIKKDGSILKLTTPGMAMGVTHFEPVPQAAVTLEKDDLLFLYTDGVTEAHNPNQELYGEDRLMLFLTQNSSLRVDELLEVLLQEIQTFARGHAQYDDITMLTIRIR